jgi:hypothetical protein
MAPRLRSLLSEATSNSEVFLFFRVHATVMVMFVRPLVSREARYSAGVKSLQRLVATARASDANARFASSLDQEPDRPGLLGDSGGRPRFPRSFGDQTERFPPEAVIGLARWL